MPWSRELGQNHCFLNFTKQSMSAMQEEFSQESSPSMEHGFLTISDCSGVHNCPCFGSRELGQRIYVLTFSKKKDFPRMYKNSEDWKALAIAMMVSSFSSERNGQFQMVPSSLFGYKKSSLRLRRHFCCDLRNFLVEIQS